MSDTVIGALIGVIAFVLGHVTNAVLTSFRDRRQLAQKRIDTSRFARAELVNLTRHIQANLIKLESMLETSDFGAQVDFEKLRYTKSGMVALDLSTMYMLHEALAQDLLTLSLYCRNNEIEIDVAIDSIFGAGHNSDTAKRSAVRKLRSRLQFTKQQSSELAELLQRYAEAPDKYTGDPIEWPATLYIVPSVSADQETTTGSNKANQGER